MATLKDALKELAAAPPEEFARRRNGLVSALQKAGETKAAALVKALRKPTVPVWIVNRLAQEERADVERLIALADRMKAAQLGRSGKGPKDLASIAQDQRAAAGRLLKRAAVMLREAGAGASHQVLLRIENTLAAAAADPALRESLRSGRLDRELTPPGFEVFEGAMPRLVTPSRTAARTPRDSPPPATRPVPPRISTMATGAAPARGRHQRHNAASVTALGERLARARAERERVEVEERAQRERAEAEKRLQDRRRAVHDATRAVSQARDEAKRATADLRDAEVAKRAAERALVEEERRQGR